MLRSTLCAWGAVGAGLCSAAALGQAINIDFGMNTPPPATYSGAGLPGVWNSIEGRHTSISNPQFVYNLVDLDGQATGVTLHQYGGTELLVSSDGSVDDEAKDLMNDCLVTHTQNLETCLFIDGLQNGQYEVISYAWMPNRPASRAKVRLDFNAILITVGGAWPGGQVHGVTYARHVVQVTNGFMGTHSGNVAGANLPVGAALNGIQIRPLIEGVPGDFNDDGDVTLIDYDLFEGCMAGPNVGTRPPGCTADVFDEADGDNDNDVDMADFTEFQDIMS